MKFYQAIAQNYDHIFPFKPAQLAFIEREIDKNCKVCEIGFATGSLLIQLLKKGYQMQGLELDSTLQKLAEGKVIQHQPDYDFGLLRCADMRNIAELYLNEQLDAILCLGNTLVHLSSLVEIEKFFADIYSILKSNGKLILQIINYERIFNLKLTGLPTIENEFIRFERFYDYRSDDRFVDFRTKLVSKQDSQSLQNNIRLLALRKGEIEQISKKIGFSQIGFYSNWQHTKWNDDGIPLICVLQK